MTRFLHCRQLKWNGGSGPTAYLAGSISCRLQTFSGKYNIRYLHVIFTESHGKLYFTSINGGVKRQQNQLSAIVYSTAQTLKCLEVLEDTNIFVSTRTFITKWYMHKCTYVHMTAFRYRLICRKETIL